jgi:hypothetical protein
MLSHVSHAETATIQNTPSKITPHTKQRGQPSLSPYLGYLNFAGNTTGLSCHFIFLDDTIEYTLCAMSEPLAFNTNYPTKMNRSSAG